MIKELIKLATHLDERGLAKEADALDGIVVRLAQVPTEEEILVRKIAGKRNHKYAGWDPNVDGENSDQPDDILSQFESYNSKRFGEPDQPQYLADQAKFNQKVETVMNWLSPIFSPEVRAMKVSDRHDYLHQLSSEIVRAVLDER
jgi:hypothetical protein